MSRIAAIVALITLLTGFASAQGGETLDDLEEPHAGIDRIWPVTVLEGESGKQRALVYRNAPSERFDLLVYNESGATVFNKTGTRGIQSLPALEAGDYRFFVRGRGAFQVTARAFERDDLTGFEGPLTGNADAFVLTPRAHYDVGFGGTVDVQWWDMTGNVEELSPPANRSAKIGSAYVITVRGAEGTPYSITLTPINAPGEAETPGPAIGLLLLGAGAASLFRRRSTIL